MIITSQQLKDLYSDLADKKGKIARDIKKGKLFPLVKGIYETDTNASPLHLSQYIYGPSYISFDYALAHYGLITEGVYNTITCATYNKKKIKTYANKFGTFVYRDVPPSVFSLGVYYVTVGSYSYQIATPEKALCDKMYTISSIKSINDIKALLFEDLRIDIEEFEKLNKEDILTLAPLYHTTTLNVFAKFVKGE